LRFALTRRSETRGFISLSRLFEAKGTITQVEGTLGTDGFSAAMRVQLYNLVKETKLEFLQQGLFHLSYANIDHTSFSASSSPYLLHAGYVHRFADKFYGAIQYNQATISAGIYQEIAPNTSIRFSVSTDPQDELAVSITRRFKW
jgi:hypothetical protein